MMALVILTLALLVGLTVGGKPCENVNGTTLLPLKFDNLKLYQIKALWSDGEKRGKLMTETFEKGDNGSVSAVTALSQKDGSQQWIFKVASGKTTATFVEGHACEGNSKKKDPWELSSLAKTFLSGEVNTLRDLLLLFQSKNMTLSAVLPADYHDHETGKTKHWMGCADSTDGKTLQALVCFPEEKTPFEFPYKDGEKFPVKIELSVYGKEKKEGGNRTAEQTISIEVFSADAEPKDKEAALKPPAGVFCSGSPTVNLPFNATSFSVDIWHTNSTHTGSDGSVVKVNYNTGQRLSSFQFVAGEEQGINFLERWPLKDAGVEKGKTYRVVRDLYYGFEYIISEPAGKCVGGVRKLRQAGDSMASQSGSAIEMKDGSHLLFQNPIRDARLNFSSRGQFKLDSGIEASLYAAQTEKKDAQTYGLIDAYFKGSRPLALNRYSYGSKSTKPTVDRQTYESFEEHSGDAFPWEKFEVQPCLAFSPDSFFYITIQAPLGNLTSDGISALSNALRTFIARKANVSLLRIGPIFMNQNGTESTYIFFTIAEKNDKVKPAEMKDLKKEISSLEAAKNLNATLSQGFKIGTKNVTFSSEGVQRMPEEFHPASGGGVAPTPHIDKHGYSGGSMAALAICMMLIGGVMGLVVAFFLWKRNRGIAYQVYE